MTWCIPGGILGPAAPKDTPMGTGAVTVATAVAVPTGTAVGPAWTRGLLVERRRGVTGTGNVIGAGIGILLINTGDSLQAASLY